MSLRNLVLSQRMSCGSSSFSVWFEPRMIEEKVGTRGRSRGRTKVTARGVLGHIYVYLWVKRANLRDSLEHGAHGILILFLLLLLLEVVLEYLGVSMALSPRLAIKVAFILAIAILLYTKLKEWSDRRQQFYFVEAARKLVELLSGSQVPTAADETFGTLLALYADNFARKGQLNANLAFWCSDDSVKIRYCHPLDAGYKKDYTFVNGQGAAAYCCENQCVVYIPRKDIRHAIVQNIGQAHPYDMVPDLYVPGSGPGVAFQSVLCVPLLAYGTCFGVLNFDSRKSNPFRVLDFAQALFFGFIVAQLLHLNQTQGHAARPAARDR
jgi:hypothetical protein